MELYEHISDLAGIPQDKAFIMPVPFMNQINGGVHSGNALAMQEFMVRLIQFRIMFAERVVEE